MFATIASSSASDWTYAGEGGKHALFSYHSISDDDHLDESNAKRTSVWKGRLLRLRKSDLAKSTSMNHSTDADFNNNTVEYWRMNKSASDEPSLDYIRRVVQPLLHPYVDEPEIVILSWSFVFQLRQQALPYVATTRLDDWNHQEEGDDDNEEPQNHRDHKDNNNDLGVVVAYLLFDYRVLLLHGLKDHINSINNSHHTSNSTGLETQSGESVDLYDDGCLSIELKPKAGYITCSPLVDPKHRIKFTQSRFSILQKRTMTPTTTTIKKKKKSLYQQNSLYNPLDLFSQDESRVSLALQHLWNCPRNNFCIWWNGQAMVTGDDEGVMPQQEPTSSTATAVTTDTSSWTAMHEFLTGASMLTADQVIAQQIIGNGGNNIAQEANNTVSSDSTTLETTKHVLLSAITAILLKEPLLAKLRQLQLLDVIDADGALVIYQHLLQAFQGHSREEVEAMIDATANVRKSTLNSKEIYQLETRTLSHSHAAPPSLQASPFEPPDDPALAPLCDHLTAFSQQLQQDALFRKGNGDENVRFTSSDFERWHDEARQVALNYIEHSLTLESNIYLLQNWLLSLAMCDASFFITLRPVLLDDAVAMCNTSVERFEEQKHGVMPEPQSNRNSNNHRSSGAGSWVVQRTYSGDATPGIIFRYSSMRRAALQTTEWNASPDAAFLYAVKVIDCDQKPARKLRTRSGKEQVFQDFFEIKP